MSELMAARGSPEISDDHSRHGIAARRMMIAIALVVAAIAAGSYELAILGLTGQYSPITLGAFWYSLDVGSLNLMQAVVQRFLHPGLWDPVIVWLLRWPIWSLLGGPGIALAIVYMARRN